MAKKAPKLSLKVLDPLILRQIGDNPRIPCMAFLLCKNVATVILSRKNPILGWVPACKRCRDHMDAIGKS